MTDRQKILETNRSIRTIKQELENLLGHGAIDESTFDSLSNLLPAEGSIRAGPSSATPTPAPAPAAASDPSPAPPAYNQTPAPEVPATRDAAPPAAPPPSGRPVLSTARALYMYVGGGDARDLAFNKDDRIDVYEHMNPDWWMGRNQRTGAEGIFPANYVLVEEQKAPIPGPGFYGQQPMYAPQPYGYHQPQQSYYPPQQPHQQQAQPGPAAPASNDANPMVAVSEGNKNEGGGGMSKLEEGGKKFGKKLGNAAIFGAGATIGSNIVNSIF
ncbi:[PSI+] inducibility protein 3 [Ceratocystis platani]|uniref:[PSI+] inducibility protein 3 n=1 Tax=Ceratocystis fimbriata f. sp. platani TaxID=88771 RepID=A0A0F8BP09_CERFI|nr:[PSI+] inducibility protein 3 [Ceratocystis platani]